MDKSEFLQGNMKKTTNEKQFIAHVREEDGEIQALTDHLHEVGELSAEFTQKINIPDVGRVLGLLHDFGKFSTAFQIYINSAEGRIQPDDDEYIDARAYKGKIDHSSAGAQYIWHKLRKFGSLGQGELVAQILAICIASHHSGLINCINRDHINVFTKRIKKSDKDTHLSECSAQADASIMAFIDSLSNQELVKSLFGKLRELVDFSVAGKDYKYTKIESFNIGIFCRFLFSCLVDADRINSAEFESPSRKQQRLSREKYLNWTTAIERFETHISQLEKPGNINKIRQRISNTCKERSMDPPGIYSLTVPTGGGKTLASLRYALHHAHKHGMKRIIYIIPFTSIIEQNALEVRKILENDNDPHPWILEQHSNLEPEYQTWHSKLVSENWDSPIIFTTMVQFLEVLFGGGTRSVRRMHQLANSVLIFDEIQTLPIKCTHLFCNSLNFLRQLTNTTAVLCTATQPLLDKLRFEEKGQLTMAKDSELVGDAEEVRQLFSDLTRVKINDLTKPTGWTCDEICELALQRSSTLGNCLLIVNTKSWAQQIYNACSRHIEDEAIFHLSTSLYPAHRKAKLKEIKERLLHKLPVLCISTQLIEAGVDISFNSVIRFLAGLDSIAQAAGRCNRHGELKNNDGKFIRGQVDVINADSEKIELLKDIQAGQEKTKRVFCEISDNDFLGPAVIKKYFQYYFYDRAKEMDYPIAAEGHPPEQTLLNLLGQNSLNPYSDKTQRQGKLPLMRHSFMEAGKLFKAIEAPTRAVIVRHKKGKELVSELCRLAREFEPEAYYSNLKEAQQYSVNLFPNVWDKLMDVKAIHETQPGEGIYYLDEEHYSNEFGVSVERIGNMEAAVC